MNGTRKATWRRAFGVSRPELQHIELSIVQVERELADLERSNASVGQLLPSIRKLHDLQGRASELRGNRPRTRREQGLRLA